MLRGFAILSLGRRSVFRIKRSVASMSGILQANFVAAPARPAQFGRVSGTSVNPLPDASCACFEVLWRMKALYAYYFYQRHARKAICAVLCKAGKVFCRSDAVFAPGQIQPKQSHPVHPIAKSGERSGMSLPCDALPHLVHLTFTIFHVLSLAC